MTSWATLFCPYCNNVPRVCYFKDKELIELKDLKIPASAQSAEEPWHERMPEGARGRCGAPIVTLELGGPMRVPYLSPPSILGVKPTTHTSRTLRICPNHSKGCFLFLKHKSRRVLQSQLPYCLNVQTQEVSFSQESPDEVSQTSGINHQSQRVSR